MGNKVTNNEKVTNTEKESIHLLKEVEIDKGSELCQILRESKDAEAVELMKTGKYDLNEKIPPFNSSLFMMTCCRELSLSAEYLLIHATVDPLEISGSFTALLYASRSQNKNMQSICLKLIEMGANTAHYSDQLLTPICEACCFGNSKTAMALLKTGNCQVGMGNPNGYTPLYWAIRHDMYDVINYIIKHHSDEYDFLGYYLPEQALITLIKSKATNEYYRNLLQRVIELERGKTTTYAYRYPPYPLPSGWGINYIDEKEFEVWYTHYLNIPLEERFYNISPINIKRRTKLRNKHEVIRFCNKIESEYYMFCEDIRRKYIKAKNRPQL